MKPIKLTKSHGKWYVIENGKITDFDKSSDAWLYIFLLKELRPHTTIIPKPLYPVYTLNPIPQMKGKKVCFTGQMIR